MAPDPVRISGAVLVGRGAVSVDMGFLLRSIEGMRGYPVTAPSAAECTSLEYLARTPRV